MFGTRQRKQEGVCRAPVVSSQIHLLCEITFQVAKTSKFNMGRKKRGLTILVEVRVGVQS